MSKLVCSLDTANCMIHRCEKCPGNDNLRHYLSTILKARDMEVFINYSFNNISVSILKFLLDLCSSHQLSISNGRVLIKQVWRRTQQPSDNTMKC